MPGGSRMAPRSGPGSTDSVASPRVRRIMSDGLGEIALRPLSRAPAHQLRRSEGGAPAFGRHNNLASRPSLSTAPRGRAIRQPDRRGHTVTSPRAPCQAACGKQGSPRRPDGRSNPYPGPRIPCRTGPRSPGAALDWPTVSPENAGQRSGHVEQSRSQLTGAS